MCVSVGLDGVFALVSRFFFLGGLFYTVLCFFFFLGTVFFTSFIYILLGIGFTCNVKNG